MRTYQRNMLLIVLPLLLGGLISFAFDHYVFPGLKISFRIDISMLVFLFGIFSSLLIAIAAMSSLYAQRKYTKNLNSAILERDESHRRFIHRLDHEIKNPLTALQAALANLREASTFEDHQNAEVNAGNAVERLSRLLGDLRKLSELSERPLEHLSINVTDLLTEMIEVARSLPHYQARNINLLITQIPGSLPSVTGDRDLLGLAIYNLLDNALKFTHPEDVVEVRAFEDGRSLMIEVADNGSGIPPEESSRIFEELYRGANARGIEGSGLGLALVQKIVSLHGGQVAVRSRLQGSRGTIFTLRLPVTTS